MDKVGTALAAAAIGCMLVAGCARKTPADADVIIIGGGIAGLSAALEASADGARVVVVEANSVGGGHAVKAGGLALVGTPLQETKGYKDDPDTAFNDLMAWGEDADAGWVRRYVTDSRTQVHDWLTGFGVRFTFILDTPEHSVPRFHFASGSARNVVVPMMAAAFKRANLSFRFSSEAEALLTDDGRVEGVRVRDLRTGKSYELHAPSVVIATGGFEANLDLVNEHWRAGRPRPEHLYVGAAYFAKGDGLKLGTDAGASLARIDHQVTFTTGIPDPGDPTGQRALLTQNPAAIWVDSAAQRFVSEKASTKVADNAVFGLKPVTHFLVYDSAGVQAMRVRDAVWLNDADAPALFAKSPYVFRGETLEAAATAAGLPPAALAATVARYNGFVDAGVDADFGRFDREHPDRMAAKIGKPPYFIVQLFPLTRKSMGGLAIDEQARVVNAAGKPVPGLFAAGEATGVAGINGSYGGEGTFLGPSVYLGRIAGREAAAAAGARAPTAGPPVVDLPPLPAQGAPSGDPAYRARAVSLDRPGLEALAAADRPGFWHFQAVHRVILKRGQNCLLCHSEEWPTKTAETPVQHELQLRSCDQCH